jgi:hypothetical protein
VRRKLRWFGTGSANLATKGLDPDMFARIGPRHGLVGTSLAQLATAGADGVRASVAGGRELANVDPGSGEVPTVVSGYIEGGSPGEKRDIAVAVNGRVEAVGRSFYLIGFSGGETFAVMIPESALRAGRNEVRLYEVGGEPGRPRLRLLGG